jgi:hypothetical protein
MEKEIDSVLCGKLSKKRMGIWLYKNVEGLKKGVVFFVRIISLRAICEAGSSELRNIYVIDLHS